MSAFGSTRAEIVFWAQTHYEDLDFGRARQHVAAGGLACGYLPVYAPREVLHAAGYLPVGIHGGGDRLEIIRGDAYFQSYICHLPRSVVELQASGRLSALSAMVFPSTCDVIRNLSGMWQVLAPEVYVRYNDIPQVADREMGAAFWAEELRALADDLGARSGVAVEDRRLWESIRLYNEVRAVIEALYAARCAEPWRVPTEELYLLMRAGEVVPPEEFLAAARLYLELIAAEDVRPRDRVRVVVMGAFCEQPPLGVIKTLERAGCYIVDDDFLLGNRFVQGNVGPEGDPYLALGRALVERARPTSVLYEADPAGKRALVAERAMASRADGVIFMAPSFCDPALLDRPMLRAGAEAAGIPCIAFKYAENTGQFQAFREQAGTFADSLKLWGSA